MAVTANIETDITWFLRGHRLHHSLRKYTAFIGDISFQIRVFLELHFFLFVLKHQVAPPAHQCSRSTTETFIVFGFCPKAEESAIQVQASFTFHSKIKHWNRSTRWKLTRGNFIEDTQKKPPKIETGLLDSFQVSDCTIAFPMMKRWRKSEWRTSVESRYRWISYGTDAIKLYHLVFEFSAWKQAESLCINQYAQGVVGISKVKEVSKIDAVDGRGIWSKYLLTVMKGNSEFQLQSFKI